MKIRLKYYNTCPHCGANLDPCERCDCTEIKNNKIIGNIKASKDKAVKKHADELTKANTELAELKAAQDKAAIADEFSDMAYTASVSIDANRQAFTNESSEITHFNQLITKVIDPYTEGINTHSIRGYAMAFRH